MEEDDSIKQLMALVDAAKVMFNMFNSLVEAGFTEPQALVLVGQMIQANSK